MRFSYFFLFAFFAVGCDDHFSERQCPQPVNTDPKCPETWSGARTLCQQGAACTTPGYDCWYPGAGDGDPNDCGKALLACKSGPDGGPAEYTCAQ